tara:strand:+ start:270 stop:536 length:267 start_codon:yes stop_codon:yes gene_type:complete
MTQLNYYLVPKKYHSILAEVSDNFGVVEVVLKEGWEYDVGSSLACYERGDPEFSNKNGTPSQHKLKRTIAQEIERTNKIPLSEWYKNH